MSFIQSVLGRIGTAGEFMQFLWERKLWWLMPMAVLLFAFGVLIMLAQSSAIAPFIYTLF